MFGAGATAVLLSASVAYACTTFTGKLTITRGSTSSVAVGEAPGTHAFCSLTGGASGSSGETITVTVAGYVNTGPSDPCPSSKLRQSADDPGGPQWVKNPACWLAGDLPNPTCAAPIVGQPYEHWKGEGMGTYEVRFDDGNPKSSMFSVSGGIYTYNPSVNGLCWDPMDYTMLGTLSVDGTGAGSWSGTLPGGLASDPTDASGICVVANRDSKSYPAGNPVADLIMAAGSAYGADTLPTEQVIVAPIVIL